MGLFSKKKNDDLFEMIEAERAEILDSTEGDKLPETGPAHASYALTPDEVLSSFGNHSAATKQSKPEQNPLDSLKKRMLHPDELTPTVTGVKTTDEAAKPEKTAKPETEKNQPIAQKPAQSFYATKETLQPASDVSHLLDLLNQVPKTESKPKNPAPARNTKDPLFSLNEQVDDTIMLDRYEPTATKKEIESVAAQGQTKKTRKTLLEKCRPYILDDSGKDSSVNAEPLYQLESVAEILHSDSQRTIDLLSKKYGIEIDDLGKTPPVSISKNEPKAPAPPTQSAMPEPFEPDVTEPEIFEDSLSEKITVTNYQTSLPDISDIDNFVAPREVANTPLMSDTATIRFTPIKQADSDTAKISLSQTHPIDLTGELGDLSFPEADTANETQLEETEFEDFEVNEEYRSFADAKRLILSLSRKKRSAFLRSVSSVLLCAVLAAFELPVLNDLLLTDTRIIMILCVSVLGAITAINFDMFLSLGKLFTKRINADPAAALAATTTLIYGIIATVQEENGYELCLLGAVILTLRAIGQFLSRSALLGNLRQIATPNPKKAICLIHDEATTFAMAKNAIEGDVLIAALRKTDTVGDYMKYSLFGTFFGGKLPIVLIVSLMIALASGFAAAAFFGGMLYGFYVAAAVMCLAAVPSLFLIDALPLNAAACRLNRKGGMIAGKTAAERLELANAVVVSSNELFPVGTVTLHNMKILSENSVDETIVRAASLTDAVGSPLSPIFKKIAGTNTSYALPDSDTVKYEDKMGLSGWVDNELLFIGNRTLMQAHGITVPDIEVDRKILRKGYFPVYLASGGKACALIIIQYSASPAVVRELRSLTGLGVTLLVNNCDPNLTEEMICDYLGLYDDSVKIMSNAGVHIYKNAVTPAKVCSAPAACRGDLLNFVSVINCASKIKKSNTLLTVFYVLASCLGIVTFAYLSFSGTGAPPLAGTVLLYELGCTVLAYLIYLLRKP